MSSELLRGYIVDDRELLFLSFSWLLSCFATFAPYRLLKVLNYGREREYSRVSILMMRVPAAVCVVGVGLWLLLNFTYRLLGIGGAAQP